MLIRLTPFYALSMMLAFVACEDETLAPDFPEPMVRVRDMAVSPPIYTQAGQEAGTESMAGYTALAGMMMEVMAGSESTAGLDTGGSEVVGGGVAEAGTTTEAGEIAGSQPGGMTGSETGGMAGSEAGATPSTELSCLGILECLGNCNEDSTCINDCISNGSVEGITALNELVGCDQAQNCSADANCLTQRCAAELIRCETGMTPNTGGTEMAGAEMAGVEMAGAEMAGAEMAGAEMAGAEMAGAEMAGAEMSGAEMAGAEMGGSTVPVDPLNCTELFDCVIACPDEDQNCVEGCLDVATPSATEALISLAICEERNMCTDLTCMTNFCNAELIDCERDGRAPIACFFDLECPISLPVCVDGACAECEYSDDCALGYTCEQNSCVEISTDCESDFYEPNNDQASATSALLTSLITAEEELTFCVLDQDYYEVEVCPNGTVTSTVRFDSAQADIDTQFIFPNAILYEQIANGVGGVEQMTHTNLSNSPQIILLHVYPYDPVSSVSYTLELNFECP